MSIFIGGFLGIRLYAISPATRFDAKLSIERRLVYSMLHTFLSSSLTVSAKVPGLCIPVSEYLSKQPLGEVTVSQRFTVVGVARRKGPLYYLATVVDYDVQLEAVEPSHRAFALGCPSSSSSCICQPSVCEMIQGAWNRWLICLYICPMHMSGETAEGEVPPSPASPQSGCRTGGVRTACACVCIYSRERTTLGVAVSHGMEEYKNSHHIVVRHEAWAVAMLLSICDRKKFFFNSRQNSYRNHP